MSQQEREGEEKEKISSSLQLAGVTRIVFLKSTPTLPFQLHVVFSRFSSKRGRDRDREGVGVVNRGLLMVVYRKLCQQFVSSMG